MLNNSLMLPQWIELLYLLVIKELNIRYKRSILGYFWAIANPFAFAFVYWIAFKFIMRIQMENYSVFLLTGMFPWTWMNQAIIQGTGCYTNNSSLVRRVKLPKLILPLSNVVQEMIHFVFAIPVIFFFIFISGCLTHPLEQIWQIPIMLVIQLMFVYPITILFGLLNVFVRDIQYIVGILFSILFFATPMVYPINMVPEKYRIYSELNPLFPLIESWRGILIDGVISFSYIMNIMIWSAALSIFAALLYRRLSGKIAELV
ncbi:MAG: ABC transporter permease [Desulfobacterales bacterium]|nr:ABC transporter permease [Desulfobacterales bacterium]